jgi:transcriptional regulator with XRE-family HTH domain
LGPAVRRLRRAAGLTLVELAEQSGLSQPFLSQIETNQAMPSLLALHRVAVALGTSTHALLEPTPQEFSLVRAKDGRRFALADGATVRFLVSGAGHRMEPNEVVAAANVTMEHSTSHLGEEVVYVLEGSVTVSVEGAGEVTLHPGDTYAYPSLNEHNWRSGDQGARFVIITSPPSF